MSRPDTVTRKLLVGALLCGLGFAMAGCSLDGHAAAATEIEQQLLADPAVAEAAFTYRPGGLEVGDSIAGSVTFADGVDAASAAKVIAGIRDSIDSSTLRDVGGPGIDYRWTDRDLRLEVDDEWPGDELVDLVEFGYSNPDASINAHVRRDSETWVELRRTLPATDLQDFIQKLPAVYATGDDRNFSISWDVVEAASGGDVGRRGSSLTGNVRPSEPQLAAIVDLADAESILAPGDSLSLSMQVDEGGLRVEATIEAAEFANISSIEINDHVPGTLSEKAAERLGEVLAASGTNYTLSVAVFDSDPFYTATG